MEKNEMEKFYIREIPEEEYSMTGRRNEKPQVENMEIAGGKNEEIPFREIRKEEYRKMLDEKFILEKYKKMNI